MVNSTAFNVLFTHLLLELQPTIICILHIKYNTPNPPEIEVITESLLTVVHQFVPIEPAIIIFSAEEEEYFKIEERLLMTAMLPTRLLLVYFSDDVYTILSTASLINYRVEWSVQQSRKLFLIPATMWLIKEIANEILDINPAAHVVTYELLAGDIRNVVEVCRGLNCRTSHSLAFGDGFTPRIDIRKLSICSSTFLHNQVRTTTGEVKLYECELRLLAALELHWQLCFKVEVLKIGQYKPISVAHECAPHSTEPGKYPYCCSAFVTMKIVGNYTRYYQLLQQNMPWSWQKYSLLVPNWWHWRKARSADLVAKRTANAVWVISVSALCWLSLLVLRMLVDQGCQQGVGWHLVLEMWARTLAMGVADRCSSTSAGLALATTLLGMWNAIALTGALFEVRFSGAEWQPVFQTLADVRQHSDILQFYSPRLNFDYTMKLWLAAVGIQKKNGIVTIILLADGSKEEMDYVFKSHAENGSRVYRRISDPSLMFPVWAVINPIALQSQMREFGQRLSEAGITGHLFRLKTHWLGVRDLMMWPPDEDKTQEDDEENSLWVFFQMFVALLIGSFVLFVGETLVSIESSINR